MKKINIKKVLVIAMIVLLALSITTISFAGAGRVPLDAFQGDTNSSGAIQAANITNWILGIAQVIGVGVAVVMLVVLAIKYLSAAPGEKADIKKSAFIYVVGAILLFGGVAILRMIQSTGRAMEEGVGMIQVDQHIVRDVNHLG